MTGHEHPSAIQRLTMVGQVRTERSVGGDAREYRLPALEIAEHRIAEDELAAPRLTARLRARLRPGRGEIDEPLRLPHWKRPEKQLIEQREDRRVGADPERQRHDRDDGDERCLEQRAKSELQVGHWSVR